MRIILFYVAQLTFHFYLVKNFRQKNYMKARLYCLHLHVQRRQINQTEQKD